MSNLSLYITSNCPKTAFYKKSDFSIGSFNLQGKLSCKLQQKNLAADLEKYNIGICSLQETKFKESVEIYCEKYFFLLLERKDQWHGQGFAIRSELKDSVVFAEQINSWIAVLRVRLSSNALMTVINVHAPTNEKKEERISFFDSLSEIYKKYKSDALLFIAGDFNSRVGKRQDHELSVGSYSFPQKRNAGGSQLVEFCELEDLFLCNTAFRHRDSFRATWKSPNSRFKWQVDYIICRRSQKGCMKNSRSFPATLYDSDHLLISTRISPGLFYGRGDQNRKKLSLQNRTPCLKREALIQNEDLRHQYEEKTNELLKNINKNETAKEIWNKGIQAMMKAAIDTVGCTKSKRVKFEDIQLEELSKKHMKLRLELLDLNTQKKSKDSTSKLKRKINQVSHAREKRLRELENEKLDKLAEKVEAFHNSSQMFAAIKEMKNLNKRDPLVVANKEGVIIRNIEESASVVAKHFESQFTSPGVEPIPTFSGKPRPLSKKITSDEVETALKRMKNGKAAGPDRIPIELLKALGKEGTCFIAEVLNLSFERHESVSLGDGILSAIQKVGKPKGPLSSLRPIVLLTALRKVLSLITLERSNPKFDSYLSLSQAAYRKGRATPDIVWTHRWLAAKAIRYDLTINILGLDMSRAFDTISRSRLLDILREDVNLDEDELRMCQALLAETYLQVRIKDVLAKAFQTTIGTPQGDALSPVLFAVYLEHALRELRSKVAEKPKDF